LLKLIFESDSQYALLRIAADWIWGRCSTKSFDHTNSKALEVRDNDSFIRAIIVYHNYDPDAKNIELSFCSIKTPGVNKNWLTRKILNGIFHYPFEELNLNNIYVSFASDNVMIYDLVKKLNADCYTLPQMASGGKDKVIAILKKSNWKKHRLYKDGYT
jgi:hypothetical protein